MNHPEELLQALQQLTLEVQRLNMQTTVQSSGYLLLARHLALQGQLSPDELAADLETMGQTQTEPGWQAGHAALASGLLLVCSSTSAAQRKARLRVHR